VRAEEGHEVQAPLHNRVAPEQVSRLQSALYLADMELYGPQGGEACA
jgi:hypothetical protein